MINLDDESRVLLDLARDAHNPSDDDRGRVRAALASRLGPAAGLGLATGAAVAFGSVAKAAAATGAGATAKALGAGAVVVKLVGTVVVVSATLGLGTVVVYHARRAPAVTVSVAKKAAPHGQRRASVTTTVVPAEAPAPEREIEIEEQVEENEQPVDVRPSGNLPASPGAQKAAPQARASRSARVVVTPRKAQDGLADGPAVNPTPTVANEARLIHEAVVALQSEQPARALALFDAHALLYPHGVLTEEREAERALALADLGRTAAARTAIDQFLRLHPASPLAPRLRERERLLEHPEP